MKRGVRLVVPLINPIPNKVRVYEAVGSLFRSSNLRNFLTHVVSFCRAFSRKSYFDTSFT